MIFSRHGINIEDFPSIKSYLEQFKAELKPRPIDWDARTQGRWPGRKPGSYRWWELQDTIDYYQRLERPKIIYQDIGYHSAFSLDKENLYANNTCYFISSAESFLVAYLNSSLVWSLLGRVAQRGKDGAFRLHSIYVEQITIPSVSIEDAKNISLKADRVMDLTRSTQEKEREFYSLMTGQFGLKRIPRVIETFWRLRRAALSDAVAASRKNVLPSAEKARLRRHFEISREHVRRLRREICRLEIELQHLIFDLYGLTAEEVQLLRETAPPRDPLTLAEEELAFLESGSED